MDNSFVKLYRKTLDSGLMQKPKTLALFMYLLMSATYKNYKVGVPGGVVLLEPGKYITGRKRLAADLKQTTSSIERGLDTLQKLDIIGRKTNNKYSIITILNWDKYQSQTESGQQTDSKRTPSGHLADTKQEGKKERKIYTPFFESLWRNYPEHRRTNKQGAFKKWKQQGCETDGGFIVSRALEWAKSGKWTEQNGDFVPAINKWILEERWLIAAPGSTSSCAHAIATIQIESPTHITGDCTKCGRNVRIPK